MASALPPEGVLPAGWPVVHQHSAARQQLEPSVVTLGKIDGLPPRPRIWSTHRHGSQAARSWRGGHGPNRTQASGALSSRGSPSLDMERHVFREALPLWAASLPTRQLRRLVLRRTLRRPLAVPAERPGLPKRRGKGRGLLRAVYSVREPFEQASL